MHDPLNLRQINAVNASSEDVWATLHERKEPVVFRALLAHWPVVKQAKDSALSALRMLTESATNEPVTVYNIDEKDNGRVFYNDALNGFTYRVLSGPFSKLSSQLESNVDNGSYYLGSTLVERWFPEFHKAHLCPLDDKQSLKSLWLGQKSKVAIHCDFPLNLACNIIGKRRFVLFPPDQIDNLYIGSIDYTPAGRPISMVDINNPDFDKFPKFATALDNAVIVDLEPGDCLYIPSMWWHYVEGLDAINAQINYWWREERAVVNNPTDSLTHAMLAIRHLPLHERKAWQAFFDYYLFSDVLDTHHIPNALLGMLDESNTQLSKQVKQQIAAKLSR